MNTTSPILQASGNAPANGNPRMEVLRAVTHDGTFRVITVDATYAVQGVIAAQRASGTAARHLGDLVVAAVLFRETMAPDLRVQVILKAKDGRSRALADSIAGGSVRGLLQMAEGTESFELGPGAVIQVMRTLHDGRVAQGLVKAPTAESGVAGALMEYMQLSEQVDSMIAIGTRFEDGRPVRAAGYMVQLLPEVGKAPLAVMAERLEDFRNLDGLLARKDFGAGLLLTELLWGMPFEYTGRSTVQHACWCTRLRVVSALASLGADDIRELSESKEALEICCEYCRREYSIAGHELRGLLTRS